MCFTPMSEFCCLFLINWSKVFLILFTIWHRASLLTVTVLSTSSIKSNSFCLLTSRTFLVSSSIFFPLRRISLLTSFSFNYHQKKYITTFVLGIVAPDGKHDHGGGHQLHASAIVKSWLHDNYMQDVHALLS